MTAAPKAADAAIAGQLQRVSPAAGVARVKRAGAPASLRGLRRRAGRLTLMGRWIDLDAPAAGASDQRARGWLASPPEGASGPAVLVLHAWWGLNETARDAADRLAREGFVALAPDMYGGVVVDTIEDAEREGQRRSDAEIRPVVDAAVARLTGDDAVVARGYGVVGFSYGAAWALDQAAADPDVLATVVVYGTGGPGTWTPGGAVLGHFAADDPY